MARFCMRTFLLVALPVALMACAQGFEGNGDDDDDSPSVDAPISSQIDARVIDGPSSNIDAPASTIDAPTSSIDAPIGLPDAGTGACTTHAQCGAGSCCFGMLMCVPGDPLPLPPPFDCLPS